MSADANVIGAVQADGAADRPKAATPRETSTSAGSGSADPIKVGVYVKTLEPPSPASARFQGTILEGLRQIQSPNVHFVVLSDSVPPGYEDDAQMSFVALATPSPEQQKARRRKLLAGGIARRLLTIVGRRDGAAFRRITDWLAYEPAYYAQLSRLNVRLIWNLGLDILPSPMPYVLVLWDLNYCIHSMFPEFSFFGDTYNFYKRDSLLLQGATYAVVGTEQGKREVIDIFGGYPGKIKVIPFPTPSLPGPADAAKTPSETGYIYYPARFWPHKNHVVLLRALRILRDKRGVAPRCMFSGIDNGNLAFVLQEAERLGVRDQIEYLGNVSTAQLADLYRGAAALAYCSLVGPDNFPPLEAMSVGCPVVAADVPGASEQYGDAALLFDPTDESQLADCLWKVLDDPALRARLVKRGVERAAAWTPAHYARAMVDLIDDFARRARTWPGAEFEAKWV